MEKSFTLSPRIQWFFLLFILLSAFISSAQITITHDDMPVAGTVIMNAMDTATITDPGNAGMNQTWDFSSAISYLSDTVIYKLPSEVPGGDLFPGANLTEVRTIYDPEGNLANYIFWNSASDGMYALGLTMWFGFPGYSYNSIQHFDPNPNTLILPVTFGSTGASSTTGTQYSSIRVGEMLLDSTMVISHISFTMNADGSGTLITPVDSYEALRIVEVSNHVDSTFTWNQTSGWEFERVETFELTNYRWFANDYGEVATLSINDGSANFQFLSSILINVADIKHTVNVVLYPNPAGDILYVSSGSTVTKTEIYTSNGQLLFKTNQLGAVDISSLKPGMYVCKVYTNNGDYISKFIKK